MGRKEMSEGEAIKYFAVMIKGEIACEYCTDENNQTYLRNVKSIYKKVGEPKDEQLVERIFNSTEFVIEIFD